MNTKFITLTLFAAPHDTIMVNPRRVNCFVANRHPTCQPELKGKLGTVVEYNPNDYHVVRETFEEIKQLLK